MPRLLIPIFLLVALAGQLSAQIVAFGASNVAGASVEPQQALLPFVIKALTQPTIPAA